MTADGIPGGPDGASIDLRDDRAELSPEALDDQVRSLLADGPVPASYDVAVEAHHLAKVLSAAGRPDEAVALYERAVAIKAAVLGDKHPEVATTLHNLALLLETLGRTAEAQARWAQARAVLESAAQAETAP
ncbi:MAG: tetratricopeptide repeat protein [Acidimicrobiales bacterium]